MEELLTSEGIAGYLNITVTTVQRMTRTGKLPHLMVGSVVRYRLSDVQQWLEQNRQKREKLIKKPALYEQAG